MDSGSPNPRPFTGKDLIEYLENVRSGNLEAVTWSATVEVEGHYPYPIVKCTQSHKLTPPKTTYDE